MTAPPRGCPTDLCVRPRVWVGLRMRPIRQQQNLRDMSCGVNVAKDLPDAPDLIFAGHDETDLRREEVYPGVRRFV